MPRARQQSPIEIAIDTLARLAAAGVSPARMSRHAVQIVSGWRATADSDKARTWTEGLLADVSTGLVAAEGQMGDVNASEVGAVKHARAVVAALRSAREALASELAGM